MHVYYIMIKSTQKFWVVYVRYRFIPEQCETSELLKTEKVRIILFTTLTRLY